MNKVITFINILRPINLFIIAITLWLFWTQLISPGLVSNNIDCLLSDFGRLIFTLQLMIMAGAGYVINDVEDIKTDLINKKSKIIVGEHIPIKQAKIYFYALNIAAFSIALYLSSISNNFIFLSTFSIGTLVLWLYSKKLKSSVLLGNIIISMAIAVVPYILIIIEETAFQQLLEINSRDYVFIIFISFSYAVFAFMSNFLREVIKDCEDAEGDMKAGVLTIATVLGLKRAEILITGISAALLIMVISLIVVGKIYNNPSGLILIILVILFPIGFIVFKNISAERNKNKYSFLSTLTKIVMGLGLVYLLLYLNVFNA